MLINKPKVYDIVVFGDIRETGGISRHFANLCKVWVSKGYKVAVVGYRDATGFFPEETEDIIDFYHLKVGSKLLAIVFLAAWIKCHKPKVLLTTTHVDNVVACWVARLGIRNLKVVLTVHGHIVLSQKGGLKKREKRRHQMKNSYGSADAIIAVSTGVKESLAAELGERSPPLFAIPNGILDDEFFEKAKEGIDHPWLEDHDIKVVISAGRLSPEKDYGTLIDAFSKISSDEQLKLIILGEGPLRKKLEEKVRDKGMEQSVALPGYYQNPYAWLRRADVFALSSSREAFGNVLIEALALGLTVVSTDCPSGPAEILENGKLGYLVKPGDSSEMASALIKALYKEKMVVASDNLGEYYAHNVAEKYLEVFNLRGTS